MQDLIERRAALTALCEDCLQKYGGICPHPASRCEEFRAIKQLPAIEAEPVRHGRWIPVENALPEEFIYVICGGNDGMAILRYNGDVWVDDAGCAYSMSAITHWMPLPEPPEKE